MEKGGGEAQGACWAAADAEFTGGEQRIPQLRRRDERSLYMSVESGLNRISTDSVELRPAQLP